MEVFSTVVVGGAIFLYAAFVIRKRIKDIKNGRFCQCSCEGCSGSCKKCSSVH
ncbi:FeoB-associated Cys-rich membrane protein [Murimonas intestini]|uniref:FeoB-associated Cys-rich membrane protein n=1 Tax=Murimonas intestini TaxID=1337051 RepID=UPI000D6C4D2E|nr:FeoB-associated Cys-rich membrane protein [Murimonas intestini]MCR1840730.1 FeoB-associated Cys-rich membrane protein [Murimonas intestini]MCR1865218.1 FeoB-associated Cys-rich membrane protein [Murimonas intestini]MCR1883071.1 FeoB-associated Cys-rich membrane protein [Murimonas intestini]